MDVSIGDEVFCGRSKVCVYLFVFCFCLEAETDGWFLLPAWVEPFLDGFFQADVGAGADEEDVFCVN